MKSLEENLNMCWRNVFLSLFWRLTDCQTSLFSSWTGLLSAWWLFPPSASLCSSGTPARGSTTHRRPRRTETAHLRGGVVRAGCGCGWKSKGLMGTGSLKSLITHIGGESWKKNSDQGTWLQFDQTSSMILKELCVCVEGQLGVWSPNPMSTFSSTAWAPPAAAGHSFIFADGFMWQKYITITMAVTTVTSFFCIFVIVYVCVCDELNSDLKFEASCWTSFIHKLIKKNMVGFSKARVWISEVLHYTSPQKTFSCATLKFLDDDCGCR